MKKLLIFIGVLGISGFLYAATINQPIPSSVSVLTAAQVLASTPTYTGQLVVCNNCKSINAASYSLCVGTETSTAANGFIIIGSSLAAVTACN